MSFFFAVRESKGRKENMPGHVFRPWEIPLTFGRIQKRMWTRVSLTTASAALFGNDTTH